MKPGEVIERMDAELASTPALVVDRLADGSPARGDLVVPPVRGKTETGWITLHVGRVYVAGLIATPSLPDGFGPFGDGEAPGP
jgi:hypothetical protein